MSCTHYVCPQPLNTVPFRFGRLRLGARWLKYLLWSTAKRHPTGVLQALKSLSWLTALSAADFILSRRRVCCNICGWTGMRFYPNAGPGYYERDTSCPRCHCIHRYRSLAAVLDSVTDFFSVDTEVIEVAPTRSFQAYSLFRKDGKNYLSFDLERFAMEKGDLTHLRFVDCCCDYFLCFHVLEHVPDEAAALREIFRVLRPGGRAVLQVPIDDSLKDTVEYGAPNPLETGHVRRYCRTGFIGRLRDQGFAVQGVSTSDLFERHDRTEYGFSPDPIYVARKPDGARH